MEAGREWRPSKVKTQTDKLQLRQHVKVPRPRQTGDNESCIYFRRLKSSGGFTGPLLPLTASVTGRGFGEVDQQDCEE